MAAFLAPLLGLAGGLVSAIGGGSGGMDEVRRMTRDAALGKGPSAAQAMLNRDASRAQGRAQGLQASGPGTSAALQQRNAVQAGAQAGADAAQNAAIIRSAEQQQARQQLAGIDKTMADMKKQQFGAIGQGLSALGGGMVGMGAPQGGAALPGGTRVASNADAGGMGSALTARPQAGQGYSPQADPTGRIMGRMGMSTPQTGAASTMAGLSSQTRVVPQMPDLGFLGGILGGLPSFPSDERLKSAVEDAGLTVDEFLDALRSRRFRIADDGGTPRTGVMAQDMEQSQLGEEIVQEGPGGVRMVDPRRAQEATLAGLARLNERIRALEGAGSAQPREMRSYRDEAPPGTPGVMRDLGTLPEVRVPPRTQRPVEGPPQTSPDVETHFQAARRMGPPPRDMGELAPLLLQLIRSRGR